MSKDKHNFPTMNDLNYWALTMEMLSFFVITLCATWRIGSNHEHKIDGYEYPDEGQCLYNNNYSYIDFSSLARWTMGIGLVTTTILNAMFGRRPSNDNHHDPLYHQIVQGAGYIMPTAFAIGHSILHFAGTTIFGSRAQATEHIVSQVAAGFSVAGRVGTIEDRLYDHIMDRSPDLDGNVRRIEYIAIRLEDAIVYLVETIANGGYIAMNFGVTRFTINDQNRLYVIAGIYHAADVIENTLIFPVNEYAYYAEQVVDIPIISNILQALRISKPNNPIKAVEPKKIDEIDEKIQDAIQDTASAINNAGRKIGCFIYKRIGIIAKKMTSAKRDLDTEHNEQEQDDQPNTIENRLFNDDPFTIENQDNGSHTFNFNSGLTNSRFYLPLRLPEDFALNIPQELALGSEFTVHLPNGLDIHFCMVQDMHHGGKMGYIFQHHRELVKNILDSYKLEEYLLLRFKQELEQKKYLEARISKCNHIGQKNKGSNEDDGGGKMSPEEKDEYEQEQLDQTEQRNPYIGDLLNHAQSIFHNFATNPEASSAYHNGLQHIEFSSNIENYLFNLPSNLPDSLTFLIQEGVQSGFSLPLHLPTGTFTINVVDAAHVHHAGIFGGFTENRTELENGIHSYELENGTILIKINMPISENNQLYFEIIFSDWRN